jgi:hypothetical protein
MPRAADYLAVRDVQMDDKSVGLRPVKRRPSSGENLRRMWRRCVAVAVAVKTCDDWIAKSFVCTQPVRFRR